MNIAIFEAASIIMKQPVKPLRIVAGAALGAFYACVVFATDWHIASSLGAKIVFAFILTAVVFKPRGILALVKKTAIFHGVTICCGLIVMGVLYFTDMGLMFKGGVKDGVFYFDIPLWFVALVALLSPFGAYIVQKKLSRATQRDCFVLTIVHKGKEIAVTVLSDTGNFLKDPYNGNDVIIVEANAILPIFKEENLPDGDFNNLLPGFRLIPYSSLGNNLGMIAGFTPEGLRAEGFPVEGITIGIYKGQLSQSGDYNGVSKPLAYIKKGQMPCLWKS